MNVNACVADVWRINRSGIVMSDFSKNLKRLMHQQKITATELCAGANVPKSSVSEWLAGREPKLGQPVLRVARFLGTTLDALISGTEPEMEAVNKVIGALENQFVTVHQGTYRVTLEKQVSSQVKRRNGDK